MCYERVNFVFCVLLGQDFLFRTYSSSGEIISIIASQKARSIIRTIVSTVHRFAGPTIVLSVCVDQTRGSP